MLVNGALLSHVGPSLVKATVQEGVRNNKCLCLHREVARSPFFLRWCKASSGTVLGLQFVLSYHVLLLRIPVAALLYVLNPKGCKVC